MQNDIKEFSKPSEVEENFKAGLDYPEVYVVIFAAIFITLHYGATAQMMGFLAIITVPSLVIIWLSYRGFNDSRISNVAVGLMAIVCGMVQLNLPILLGFVLLTGLRCIRSSTKNRLTIITIFMLVTVVVYYISLILKIESIPPENIITNAVLVLAIFITLRQFSNSYNNTKSYHDIAAAEKVRVVTLISVVSKLTHFLPPQVWQPIVKSNKPVKVNNVRKKITVMFSDIAGFTELSEKLSPDELADILNTYMQRMTDIAAHHNAVLDKFIGDGMVCFFGAPKSKGIREDALSCVAMAIDMRREMRTLRHQWRLQGFEGLYVRIGISTGHCHVGNFGSNKRMSYTLIGSEANLAARLETSASKGEILVSNSTYDYISHEYKCVYKGKIKLKGFASGINAYSVLDPDSSNNMSSKWVDHDLPGFNLHLNFKDIKNYDYKIIRSHLRQALEQVDEVEKESIDTITEVDK